MFALFHLNPKPISMMQTAQALTCWVAEEKRKVEGRIEEKYWGPMLKAFRESERANVSFALGCYFNQGWRERVDGEVRDWREKVVAEVTRLASLRPETGQGEV